MRLADTAKGRSVVDVDADMHCEVESSFLGLDSLALGWYACNETWVFEDCLVVEDMRDRAVIE
jgi:urease accessory protein UreH